METLVELMKKLLADTFTLYLKTHNFHWNVEGPNFAQYHQFLGDLYEEIFDSVDTTAEKIRILGYYAPGSMKRFLEMTDIQEETLILSPQEMFAKLYEDNEKLLVTLNVIFDLSTELKQQGLADYIAGRIDVHTKHSWMLRSFNK